MNNVPMSTTWVFIGMLGGRELAISLSKQDIQRRQEKCWKSLRTIRKDLRHAGIGLAISMVLAVVVNPLIHQALKRLIIHTITHWME